MYDMNDLFNSRDVVGCKLNQIIGSHKYTKSNVCTGAGISRPTLDKLLNGEVTNKTNFEKHISKLLAFLSLTVISKRAMLGAVSVCLSGTA